LYNHYRLTSKLLIEKYFSLSEIEGLVPYELLFYIDLMNEIKKEKSQAASSKEHI